jgi:hypothetical protein
MRLSLGLGTVGAALLFAAALPLADGSDWLAGVQTAAAQSAPQARKASTKRPVAKAKSKDATGNTDQQLDAAEKLLAEGNADGAMTTLEGILAGGGLANNHMARALYLRGVAHRKKARSAQAIADLTSATWLKGGLSDADRTAALKLRAEISREIGVADAGPPPTTAVAPSAPAAQVASAPAAQTGQAPAAQTGQAPTAQKGLIRRPPPIGQPGLTEGGFPRVADAPAPRQASTPRQAPSEGGFTAIVTAAPQRSAPPPRAAPEPPSRQEPVERTAQTTPAPTGLIRRPPPVGEAGLTEGGFPRIAATAPPSTPSRPAPAVSPPPGAADSGDPVPKPSGKATSSWDSATAPRRPDGWVSVDERQKSRTDAPAPSAVPNSGGGIGEFFSGMFGVAPASPPAPERAKTSADAAPWSTSTRGAAPRQAASKPAEKSVAVATSAVPPSAQGAYRLQIAAVRSRPEAEAVAARVRKEHGGVIGARRLEVDETVFGNMGTFYRVRLGPFAAADESKVLCDQLRTKGYDCLVVTQ